MPGPGCSWPCGSVSTHPGFLSSLTPPPSVLSLLLKGPGILLWEDDSLHEGTFTRDLALLGKVRAIHSSSHPIKPGLRAEEEDKVWAAGGRSSHRHGVQRAPCPLHAVLT